ncbi:unnamed protein product [Gadus morhua 'NCC']
MLALVQLLHVVMLEGVWNDEPLSTEEQTTVTREFLSHGVERSQVTWHLPKCIGPACRNDLSETPAERISQRLTLQFLNPVCGEDVHHHNLVLLHLLSLPWRFLLDDGMHL